MNASHQVYIVLKSIFDVVRPGHLADRDSLPAIVYTIIDTTPSGTLQGDTGDLDRVRVQIDAWAGSYEDALDLGVTIRNVMRSRAALVDSPLAPGDYLRANFIDVNPTFEPGRERYRWSADYYVWQ